MTPTHSDATSKDTKIMKNRMILRINKSRVYLIGVSIFLVAAMILILSGAQTPAHAQSGSGYSLAWWTVDSGGETGAQGGGYSLDSAVGQAEAAQFTSTGGGYSLQSGFWSGSAADYLTWYFPVALK
jgi:hypothetical protein